MLQCIKRLALLFTLLVGLISILSQVAIHAVAQSPHKLLAVAFQLDDSSPGMYTYIGDTSIDPFTLPDGTYDIQALNAQGFIITLTNVQTQEGQPISLPKDFAADGVQDEQRSSALKTLANFLSDANLGKLVALEGASVGFTAPLFDSATTPSQEQLDQLQAWYAEFLSRQENTLNAFDLFDTVQNESSSSGSTTYVAAVYAESRYKSIKEKLLGFFGYAGDAGKRARERILTIGNNLTPADREEAFQAVRQGFKSDATNWDEFVERLRSGELDNEAAQIESDMRQAAGFGAEAIASSNGTGDVMYKEGAELVKQGAEFEAEVIKTVLADVFPDISKGFDYAEKADEWATYIQNVYKATIGQDRNQLRELIKEHIKDDLSQCCADLPDEAIDQIATTISQRATDSIPTQPAVAANWSGAWSGAGITATISQSGTTMSASYQAEGSSWKSTGDWSNCTVDGNTATCNYTGNYEDSDKTADATGIIKATLNGDTIASEWTLETVNLKWKPGVEEYPSGLQKGLVSTYVMTRQK